MPSVRLVVPEGVTYAALQLRRDPDGGISYDASVLARVCRASGLDAAALDEDETASLLRAWYELHRAYGGAPDPVQEALREEVRDEDSDVVTRALDATGLSARRLSALIHVNERTTRRWISGDTLVLGPAVVLLRLLARHPSLAEDLAQLQGAAIDSGEVISAALAATGMSARGLAGLILVDERTMRYWIAGESLVPGPASRLLALLARHPHLIIEVGDDT